MRRGELLLTVSCLLLNASAAVADQEVRVAFEVTEDSVKEAIALVVTEEPNTLARRVDSTIEGSEVVVQIPELVHRSGLSVTLITSGGALVPLAYQPLTESAIQPVATLCKSEPPQAALTALSKLNEADLDKLLVLRSKRISILNQLFGDIRVPQFFKRLKVADANAGLPSVDYNALSQEELEERLLLLKALNNGTIPQP